MSIKIAQSLWIAHRLVPMWKKIAVSLSFAVFSGLLSTGEPLLMRRLIDVDVPHHHSLNAMFVVLAISGCLFGRLAFLLASVNTNFAVQQDVGQALRIAMLEQLNRLSAEYHETTPVGEKQSRLERDVDQISELGADITSVTVRSSIFFTVNIVVMMRLNTYIALAILPFVGVFMWVRSSFRAPMQGRADIAQTAAGRASSVLCEYLSAVPQIQLLCAEEAIVKKVVSVWVGMLQARKSQRRSELLYLCAINATLVLVTFLVLIIGSVQVAHGALTIGGLVAFYAYVTRIFEPVNSTMDLYSRLHRVGASVRRVRAVFECEATVPDCGMIVEPRHSIQQGISMSNVSFVYRGERSALQNVSLHFGPFERVAVVGPSGSGKSTLARLLARVSDPQEGEIRLEGCPLTDYSLAALRSTICYVPQQPVLFSGSVRENLLYGKPHANTRELEQVVAATQLSEVLDRLPGGLDSELGPWGSSLSGGERQRIALARALLREAPILVLDESTSALDVPTEQLVLASIADLNSRSILIIISHRLASVAWLKRIVVLNAGKVMVSGTHDTLYAESLFYRRLYQSHAQSPVN
jgi:ABC-type multidrug transport system fused ATPase/permease subunit